METTMEATYTVSWWEGETRQTRLWPTQERAMAHAAQLRARSDALPDRSLVPIRVLSTPIEQGMAFLRTVHDTEACPHKHRLMRLCPQCVAHWLAAQE